MAESEAERLIRLSVEIGRQAARQLFLERAEQLAEAAKPRATFRIGPVRDREGES